MFYGNVGAGGQKVTNTGKSIASQAGSWLVDQIDAFTGKYGADQQAKANALNIASNERINMMNIQNQREMNELARRWALEDWERQNAYNHPLQMMQRFREAGLSPQMALGSGAQSTAAMVRGTQPQPPNLSPSRVEALRMDSNVFSNTMSLIGGLMSLFSKDKEIDMINARTALLKEQQGLTSASTAEKGLNLDYGRFKLGVAQELRDTTIQTARDRNRSIQIANEQSLQSFNLRQELLRVQIAKTKQERQNAIADLALKQVVLQYKRFENKEIQPQQLERLKAEIARLKEAGQFLEFDNRLKAEGLSPHDPAWMRILTQQVKKWFNLD